MLYNSETNAKNGTEAQIDSYISLSHVDHEQVKKLVVSHDLAHDGLKGESAARAGDRQCEHKSANETRTSSTNPGHQ